MTLPPSDQPLPAPTQRTRALSRRRALGAGLAAVAGLVLAPAALANPPRSSPRPPPRPGGPVATAAPAAARQPVADLIARARLGGEIGFAAARLDGVGAAIEELASGRALAPASISKAVTAVYAIERLGAEHRFVTRVLAYGEISGGVLDGDLVLTGGGDPTLDTDALGDMATALRAAGLRSITGRFLVHGGALPGIERIDATQPDQAGYNPSVSGLILNHNRVLFEWQRQSGRWVLTTEARGNRFRQASGTIRAELADRVAPVYSYALAGGVERWSVASTALGNGGNRWLPVRRPEAYAGDIFRGLAASQGVTLPVPAIAARLPAGRARVLAENRSGDLRGICQGMLRFSTNVTAEAVGLAATAAGGGAMPATLQASASTMSHWARDRAGLRDISLVDHSGLGDASRMTAADMLRFLQAPAVRAVLPAILRDHMMRDSGGRPVPNHPLSVRAKTGTLNFVSTLAGYAELPGGQSFAFAVLSGDLPRRAALSGDARERPPGGVAWIGRARSLQQALIERWAAMV